MAKKTDFSYVGQKFTQGNSPLELLSFCATAKEIRDWAGVPQKSERHHNGFQRALVKKRSENVKRFFDGNQASPTSIVVAFRRGALDVQELAYPNAWPDKSTLDLTPKFVRINFKVGDVDLSSLGIAELRKMVAADLKVRLGVSNGDNQADDIDPEDGVGDVEGEEADAMVQGDDESDSKGNDEEIDVGHSKLRQFCDFIGSDAQVEQWVAEERRKLAESEKKGKAKLPSDDELQREDPNEKLKGLLVSLLKPAMIVDGQHRVFGAYESAANIVFSVNAIRDADWVEQVFQFVVLNKLARPIAGNFLTSILNTSLTNSEVGDIEVRLENIGIKNVNRKIMKYLDLNKASPFFGMIAEPTEIIGVKNEEKLSDKGMIRLAQRWRGIPASKKEIQMFEKVLKAKNEKDAGKKWANYESWTPFFFAFWDTMKNRYAKDGLWVKQKKFHLLYIVTMHALQNLFISSKARADTKFKSTEDFKEQIEKFFEDVPGTFFQEWKATGLQSGERSKWITTAIEMFRDGKTLAYVKNNSDLYKASND